MAKIALVFLFAFCAFQISSGARIAREVGTGDAQVSIDKAFQDLSQFLEKTFSKDNLEKMGDSLKQIGEQLADKGKELAQQADASIKKLQAPPSPAQ